MNDFQKNRFMIERKMFKFTNAKRTQPKAFLKRMYKCKYSQKQQFVTTSNVFLNENFPKQNSSVLNTTQI